MEDILVVGPGALGGVLACRWALAGCAVRILGRTPAAERRIADAGFSYTDSRGQCRRIRGRMATARQGDGCFPLAGKRGSPLAAVFFCVKSHDLSAAIRVARKWIGPQTAVVGLQNGLGHESLLCRNFGARRTVIGTCGFAAERLSLSRFRHHGSDDILLGENAANAGSVAVVCDILQRAGWRAVVAGAQDRLLWTQLCLDAAVNGLGALANVPNGRLVEDPLLKELFDAVVRETSAVARAAGHPPLHGRMEESARSFCRRTAQAENSLLADLRAGRRTESAALFPPLLSAARRTHAASQMLAVIAATLRKLEARRPS